MPARTLLIRRGIPLLILGILLVLRPPLPDWAWDPAPTCRADSLTSLLGQIWCWLKANNPAIAAIWYIVASVGVIFAALTYRRTQMLNQANAVFQTMKEARDLRLRLNPIPPTGASQQTKMFAGLHFFASIFQYRLLEFIDHRTWQPFEDDLAILLREPEMAGWLSGAPSTTRLPNLEGFDPQFIEYLKSVHRRRVLGLVNE